MLHKWVISQKLFKLLNVFWKSPNTSIQWNRITQCVHNNTQANRLLRTRMIEREREREQAIKNKKEGMRNMQTTNNE